MNFTDTENPTGHVRSTSWQNAQTVILWGPDGLLAESVESFLKTGAHWEVLKISSEKEVDYLFQQMKCLKPEVVILCQEKDFYDTNLLLQIMQVQMCLKVVTLSMESNLMQVYSKHHVVMNEVSDLLSVVETNYLPNHRICNGGGKPKENT